MTNSSGSSSTKLYGLPSPCSSFPIAASSVVYDICVCQDLLEVSVKFETIPQRTLKIGGVCLCLIRYMMIDILVVGSVEITDDNEV